MTHQRPPTIDPVASARWQQKLVPASPWLHEEVARRMQERLDWIKLKPASWLDWAPLQGGMQGHGLVVARYPNATCFVAEVSPAHTQVALERIKKPWWTPGRWTDKAPVAGPPLPQNVQMVWANMALHMASEPQALIAQWHEALAVDGFLMFSCLGPDSLLEIRALYKQLGWPVASHDFTDMHDWGDMLVAAGFAEPVMDVERIVLSFESPQRLLQELRSLGRNLHPERFAGLRTPRWLGQLHEALKPAAPIAAGEDSTQVRAHKLTFEVIYGHAVKPARRLTVTPEMSLSLAEMRNRLGL